MTPAPPPEKSPASAAVLTLLWPGAGHLYLGLVGKGAPAVAVNAVALLVSVVSGTVYLSVVVWLATLVLTVWNIGSETERVNHALELGVPVSGDRLAQARSEALAPGRPSR